MSASSALTGKFIVWGGIHFAQDSWFDYDNWSHAVGSLRIRGTHGKRKIKEDTEVSTCSRQVGVSPSCHTHIQKHTEHQKLSVYIWRRQAYCYVSSFDPDHNLGHRMKAADQCVLSHRRTHCCPHPDKEDSPMRAGWMTELRHEPRKSRGKPIVPGWELRLTPWGDHGSSLDWKSSWWSLGSKDHDPQCDQHTNWPLWLVTVTPLVGGTDGRVILQYSYSKFYFIDIFTDSLTSA